MLNMPKLYRKFPGPSAISGQKRPVHLPYNDTKSAGSVLPRWLPLERNRLLIPWHEDRMDESAMSQNASHSSKKATTMQIAIASNQVGKFPVVQFRKKRLTVAIHAHFDMQNADEVNEVKRLVEQALAQLAEDGDVKVTYALSDV